MADLDGRTYVALRRLSTKADETLAEVGETCERVPASSLPWLLASGKIAPAQPAHAGEFTWTARDVDAAGVSDGR